MVATSQPLAAQAGLDTMARGGNAVDAAVAAAAALAVTEPTGTGLGGDCFAIVLGPGGLDRAARSGPRGAVGGERRGVSHALPLAIDGSGRSPRAFSPDRLRAAGHAQMPRRGAHTITTPGAVDAWATLIDRAGALSLAEALEPAIRLATEGFPVSELVAASWRASEPLLSGHPAAAEHFLPRGRAPRAGQIVTLPAMASALRAIAEGGRDAFYDGPVGRDIVSTVTAAGGSLAAEDLAEHASRWVAPIATAFADATIWQCPPPSQGLTALLALAIAGGSDLDSVRWGGADHLHRLIEAMRLAFADGDAHIGDPDFRSAPIDTLLSPEYVALRRAEIDPRRASPGPTVGLPPRAGTVYVAAMDAAGGGCSLINSNYMGFGSGIVSERFGIPLQNRGAGFTFQRGHPNEAAPGKRPFHTIIPGLATRASDGALHSVFGVMGGHMQPQGHLQVLTNLMIFGMDPQRALDAPRFQIMPSGHVALEPWFDDATRGELRRRGHWLVARHATPGPGTFGGGQLIVVTESGVRLGGSDPRKDGQAVAR